MSSVAFIFDIIFSCLITLIFLYRCGNFRRQHPTTTIIVFISWFFSVLIIFVLPFDISLAVYRGCLSHIPKNSTTTDILKDQCPKPWSYVDPSVYTNLWRVVYWASQILTWLILPMMQSICETGEFSIKGKIRYAIKTNLIFYGSFLLIFIILMIYVAIKFQLNSSNFTATLVAASTTWGLFLLVLMLGYGLVQVPLNVYNHSRIGYILSHLQFKLSRLYNEKVEVEERLDTLIDELTKYSLQIRVNDPLRSSLEKIIQIVPEQYSNRITLTMEDYQNNRISTNYLNDLPHEKQLIRLHEGLKASIHVHHRIQASWSRMIDEAFYLEDILKNQSNPDKIFTRQNPIQSTWLRKKLFDRHQKLEWYFFCVIRKWSLRLLGLILASLSLLVIWSEMTFFSRKPVLSIFAQCISAAENGYHYFTIEVFCCLSLAYLCLCAYYTIFRIRILNYFYLSLYHLTDENSLIFAATFLCRLTAPLSYNFLGMIHFDQAITQETNRVETTFTSIMGHLVAIRIVSVGFNFYFPMLICLLSVGTYFRIGSRCLHACGFRQFFDDDDQSAEYVEDGKGLMARERRNYGSLETLSNTTTAAQRRDRRQELLEKYGLRSGSAIASNSDIRPLILSASDDEPLLGTDNANYQSSANARIIRPDSSLQTD